MLHNEWYDDAEYVYQVSAAKLFKQVRDKKLPFHRWYKWLEDKFAELRLAAKGKPNGHGSDQPDFSHLSASDEDFAQLEQRRPDSTKSKSSGFFSKLKKAISKKGGDGDQGGTRLSFGRRSMTLKRGTTEQIKGTKDKEIPLQTISESAQEKAEN